MPIDDEVYDPATHCNPAPHKGVQAAIRWFGRHSQGVNWGSYRCEKWGAGGSDFGKYDYSTSASRRPAPAARRPSGG